jgi:Protein of unknown function (DUF3140)
VSDRDDIRREFGEAVNMTPGKLSKWLKSEKSTPRLGTAVGAARRS